jgi:hypothetical protein
MSINSMGFSKGLDLPFIRVEVYVVSSFTRTCCLIVSLVKGLLGLTLTAAMGEEKTSCLPLKHVGLLEGTSIVIGSSMGEASLSEACEGPPASTSFVALTALSLTVTIFLLLASEFIVLSIGVGLYILDWGVGETSN